MECPKILFYDAKIVLYKKHKRPNKKRKFRPISLINTNKKKPLNNALRKQETGKDKIIHDRVSFITKI